MSYALSPYRRHYLPGNYGFGFGFGWLRGLGFSYYDLLAQADLQNCDPKDIPCVAANQQKQVAVEDLWVSTYMKDPNTANLAAPSIDVTANTSPGAIAAFKANQPDSQATIQVGSGPTVSSAQLEANYSTPYQFISHDPAPGGVMTQISGGQLSFNTSRGGSVFFPGDTWTVRISGASPNLPVTVTGGQNGGSNTATMGTTDGAGNFSMSGSFDSSQIGAWSELWKVGGTPSGSFSFSVKQATSPGAPAITPGQSPQGTPFVGPFQLPTVGGFDLSSVPWWGWAAGAGVLFMAFGGFSGGRR